MRGVDIILAFPGFLLAIAVVAVLGPGLVNAMVAVGVVFSPSIARVATTAVKIDVRTPIRNVPTEPALRAA